MGEAAGILESERPDVIYLDVQLRDGDGFELVPAIAPETRIVFVSGFDSYAVRACSSRSKPSWP